MLIGFTKLASQLFLWNKYKRETYQGYDLGLNEIPNMWWKDHRSVKAALLDQLYNSNQVYDNQRMVFKDSVARFQNAWWTIVTAKEDCWLGLNI